LLTCSVSLRSSSVSRSRRHAPRRSRKRRFGRSARCGSSCRFGVGSATGLTARLFAERLSVRWGQPVLVENRPGADSIVAVNAFVANHDDHTLLYSAPG
jgi:hypothetical protein